jgi:Cof subfamily protein (haloacid dehalogenase superfamily)
VQNAPVVEVHDAGDRRHVRVRRPQAGLHRQTEFWSDWPADLLLALADLKGEWFVDSYARFEEPHYVQKQVDVTLALYGLSLRGKRLLDFGCGFGASSYCFIRRGADRIVAADLEPANTDFARRFFAARGLAAHIDVRREDLVPRLQRGEFDVIWLEAVMEHLLPAERAEYLSRFWDALSPGGTLVITETPNRAWPYETHTTGGRWWIPWMSPEAAFRRLRRDARYRDYTDERFYRSGVIGSSYAEIMRCLGQPRTARRSPAPRRPTCRPSTGSPRCVPRCGRRRCARSASPSRSSGSCSAGRRRRRCPSSATSRSGSAPAQLPRAPGRPPLRRRTRLHRGRRGGQPASDRPRPPAGRADGRRTRGGRARNGVTEHGACEARPAVTAVPDVPARRPAASLSAPAVDLVCLDVDGTLVGSAGSVPEPVWAAAARVRAAGVRLCVCSGRPGFGQARDLARRLDPDGWHVFQNGASVVHAGTGESRSTLLPRDGVDRLVARARATGRLLELYTDHEYAFEPPTPAAAEQARRHAALLGVPYAPRPFAALGGPPVRAQWLTTPAEGPGIQAEPHPGLAIAASTSPVMPDTLFLNITAAGADKGAAVRAVAAAYGVPLARVMMVGDGANDVPALRAVGVPVAMGNAEHAALDAAAHRVGHVDALGLVEAFALVLGD